MESKVIFGDNSETLLQCVQNLLLATVQGSDDHYSILFISKQDFYDFSKKINLMHLAKRVKNLYKIHFKVIDELEELIQYLSMLRMLEPGPVSLAFFNFEKYFLPQNLNDGSLRNSFEMDTKPPVLNTIKMLCKQAFSTSRSPENPVS